MASSQQLILGEGAGGAAPAPQYQISRSLRSNYVDTPYLNRTFPSAGNQRTWTFSVWFKRSAFNSAELFTTPYGTGVTTYGQGFLGFAGDQLVFANQGSYAAWYLLSSAKYRDPSAWYHVVAAVDTTQATEANRISLYVNGSKITDLASASYPAQNSLGSYNDGIAHFLGALYYNASSYIQPLDGYFTEIYFIDGQALTPSSFGETNANTGVWQPKAYTGTYGTNGFYVNFSDNSGTTSTTLGKDYSGNGNNWTPNNFSVTAGAGNDSLVDTPTPYGTDTGAGGEVRGNYSTFNPLDFFGTSGLSNGNLDISAATVGDFGTFKLTSGKWYFEFRKNADGDNQLGIASGNAYGTSANLGVTCFRRAWRDNNNTPSWLTDGSNAGSGTAQSLSTGDILGIALDLDNNAVYFAKNNTWMNSGSPTSGSSKTGAIWTDLSGGTWQIYAGGNSNGCYTSLNAGQRPFAYTAPSGFKALCTQNLPTPTIGATSTAQAGDYFNAVLYTGNSSGATVSGVGFQPDFVWMKCRSTARNHELLDAVRGGSSTLFSNLTNAQATDQRISSFNSDGFTYTTNSNSANTGDTFVAWNWKANGAGSSNTQGTITSTVSANTTAGFSIVTYTGNATQGATVGHGLGVTPAMLIVKSRSLATDWVVQHKSAGTAPSKLILNSTAAVTNSAPEWNNAGGTPTAFNSTVFTIGASGYSVNNSGETYLAYVFAEVAGYSAFGSYTGNGSADGPFVYTGFRPAWLLLKNTAVSDWVLLDNKRNTYNVENLWLYPNAANAEAVVDSADFLSNGFKLKYPGGTGLNTNGNTYTYAAFAEFPFKYTLAR